MNAATRNHEAAHCALAIAACGWVPLEVRADRPDLHIAGKCTANFRDHQPDFGWLIAVVGGPLSQGKVIAWRPAEDSATDDERIAATLVAHLALERHHYLDALATARDLLGQDEVQAMVRLIAVSLDRVPVLTERDLRFLLHPYIERFIDSEGTP